jgi:hypothetical protein
VTVSSAKAASDRHGIPLAPPGEILNRSCAMLMQLIGSPPELAPTWMESPHLRLSGGILSDGLTREVIAICTSGAWIGHDRTYRAIRLRDTARLLFGLPRDPWCWSTEIRTLSLDGAALWADGARFAYYCPDCDMWRAAARQMWWHSVHLVATEAFEPDRLARPTWDLRVAPAPSHTPERRGAHPARREVRIR